MGHSDQRRGFLAAGYGRPGERFRLAAFPAGGPGSGPASQGMSWAPVGRRWAVVTAWNPGGRRASGEHNETAQRTLSQRWKGAALDGLNGEGAWAEPALILLDAPLTEALRLGREFDQAAILYGVGRRVALVWLNRGRTRIERYWAAPVGGSGEARPV
ncbi:DUF3293 domain-containing protein [Deinococcus koreensis]|uniref:DUF3293 domain-containing protein n=1 Tax=Deinococcus koreensis TaxID=2054903 RepID=UPI001FAF3CD9|nr:DUF3293 domain-containing protein [Deinococcus koreensis]